AAARRIGIPAEVSDGIEPALAGIARLDVEASPRILITGSLYLAGEVLAQNGTLPSRLKKIVARMERARSARVIRGHPSRITCSFAALHPGYGTQPRRINPDIPPAWFPAWRATAKAS